jgi:soluble lytic murein transglycosylase
MIFIKRLIPVSILGLLSLACGAIDLLPNTSITEMPQGLVASPTPSKTATAVNSPTPKPTSTPTPVPLSHLEKAEQALFYGDWDTAIYEFQAALKADPNPKIQNITLLGIGRTYYLAGNFTEARDTLLDLITNYPDPDQLPTAYFYLAQTYSALGNHSEAADAYQVYLDLNPGILDSYIYERKGDAFNAVGDFSQAIEDYQHALQSPRLGPDLDIDIKIAQAYALLGDYNTAIIGYQDIYTRTTNDYTKAYMDLLIGQAYTEMGDLDQAYSAYLDAVNNYPLSYDSYTALFILVENGIPVDELNRGLVDYYAGQYGVALAAFDRYVQDAPEEPGTGYYYIGLTMRALGDFEAAIEAWDKLINAYPDSHFWDDAWEQKAFTQWYYLDQYIKATETLLEFVAAVPTHPRSSEFLFDAAIVSERADRLEEAVEIWERVSAEYPSSEYAYRALFLAGITHFRLGDYPAAHDAFQRALSLADNLEERAAAYLWSGKCLVALGDDQAARSAWEQAASLDRTGYYSERARDLLLNQPVFAPPEGYDLAFDPESEKIEAELWIKTVFDLPADIDLSNPGPLADDLRFQRGNALWELGLYEEARLEFEDLRIAYQSDPANTYRLANHLTELGLYRSAIFAARHVLDIAGMDDGDTMSAPIYFNHLRFGTYYRDLVIANAREYDLHPLFLFSVIRQESLFEGFVRSPADARGLMQIIPSTGQETASILNWPAGYTAEDLYRPIVSINFGSNYLSRQIDYFDGDLYAALAAYNGGPGNSATWKSLAPDDPDLFLEIIRYAETRDYIRAIYEVFNIYRNIYNRPPE